MLQQILAALDSKDMELKKEGGRDYQAEANAEPNPKFNPITGLESSLEERADASGSFFFVLIVFDCV